MLNKSFKNIKFIISTANLGKILIFNYLSLHSLVDVGV